MQSEVNNRIEEELIANLLEFYDEREVEASERPSSKWSDTHAILDKLEARESTFRWMRQHRPTNEGREKETVKSDLDSIVASQNREENEFVELGKRAFYGATTEPRELALYLAERINEVRIQREVESASQSKKTSFDAAMHFIEYAPQNYIPRRFFIALIGYKCEELKKAIDDYEPQTENGTSSRNEPKQEDKSKKKNGEPLSDEFFEWLRAKPQGRINLLLLACRLSEFDPYRGVKGYQKKEVEKRLRKQIDLKQLKGFNSKISIIWGKCETLEDLGGRLVGDSLGVTGDTVQRLLYTLQNAPLSDRAKARIDELLRL